MIQLPILCKGGINVPTNSKKLSLKNQSLGGYYFTDEDFVSKKGVKQPS